MQFPRSDGYILSPDYHKLTNMQRDLAALISYYNVTPTPDAGQRVFDCITDHERFRLSQRLQEDLGFLKYQCGVRSRSVGIEQGVKYVEVLLQQLLEYYRSVFRAPDSVLQTYIDADRDSDVYLEVARARLDWQFCERRSAELRRNYDNAQKLLDYRRNQALELRYALKEMNKAYNYGNIDIKRRIDYLQSAMQNYAAYQIVRFKTQIMQAQYHFDRAIKYYAAVDEEIKKIRNYEVRTLVAQYEQRIKAQIEDINMQIAENEKQFEWEKEEFNKELNQKREYLEASVDPYQLLQERCDYNYLIRQIDAQIAREKQRLGIQ